MFMTAWTGKCTVKRDKEQEGHKKVMMNALRILDTCDLENDYQSDNEDCNGDDNFAKKLGNINIKEII